MFYRSVCDSVTDLICTELCPAEPDFSEKTDGVQTENMLPLSRSNKGDAVSTSMMDAALTSVLPECKFIHETAIVHPNAFIGEVRVFLLFVLSSSCHNVSISGCQSWTRKSMITLQTCWLATYWLPVVGRCFLFYWCFVGFGISGLVILCSCLKMLATSWADNFTSQGVVISAFCTVGPGVSIGRGTKLHPGSHICGDTELGEDCEVMK